MHTTVHQNDIRTLVEATKPSSILLIDPNPGGLPAATRNVVPDCRVTHLQGDILTQLQALAPHDLGIVANTLEHLERRPAGHLLATMRDLKTRRFVALVPIGNLWQGHTSYWEPADFLGYGMTLMARYRVDTRPLHLYHYTIETYKATPDWFNSKHWAHPERWKP